VVGAIIGLTDLGAPNFLDQISSTAYGKTGGFLLVAPQQRLVITATDKSRSMGALPPLGENPAMDAMVGGREGTDIWLRPNGVEVLTSAKTIPSSGWMVAVTLPTKEAFAPISQLQRGVLGTALALSLFAVLLVWLLLKRQLEPLAMAAAELRLRAGTQPRHYPLNVVRNDEIGDLVGGFNRLLADLQESAYAQQDTATALAIAAELQERTGAIAQVGGWQLDLLTMKLSWTRETFRIAEVQGAAEPSLADGINLFAPEARPTIAAAVQAAMDSGTPYDLELPIIGAMGTHKWVRTQGFALMERGTSIRLHGTFQDITQRKQAELQMAADLAEKTALLNEVHHRVKNNLQVIASLLRLEAGRAEPSRSDTVTVLNDMQGRIRSMALLHESLYRSGTFASVDLGGYLRQLSQQAFRSFAPSGATVGLELELASVSVSLDRAMPVGLLLNELLSNCFKHAFTQQRSGMVRVTLVVEADRCRLTVSDNGVGLPDNFAQKRENSLGLALVSDLTKQLGGVLEIGPGPGSSFALVFESKSEASQ
jgi:two-component sensor histidine kinase/PAS domain-containing protein